MYVDAIRVNHGWVRERGDKGGNGAYCLNHLGREEAVSSLACVQRDVLCVTRFACAVADIPGSRRCPEHFPVTEALQALSMLCRKRDPLFTTLMAERREGRDHHKRHGYKGNAHHFRVQFEFRPQN